MSGNALVPTVFGIIGLAAAWYIYHQVKKFPAGEAKVAEIAEAIHRGAMVFMRPRVQDAGAVLPGAHRPAVVHARHRHRLRVPRRRTVLGRRRLHRHERGNPCERAHHHRRAYKQRRRRTHGCVLRRLDHGPCGRVARSVRSRHPLSDVRRRSGDRAYHPRIRNGRIQRRTVLSRRRRHLHQERRHRGGSRRQDRGGHPGGRPAQPRRDRGQRRRQRR